MGGEFVKVKGAEQTDTAMAEITFVPLSFVDRAQFILDNVEKLHPEVAVWETVTPYFEKRNIHFYVNRCGFHIVEFFNSHHPDPDDPEAGKEMDEQFPDGVFRFEKKMG